MIAYIILSRHHGGSLTVEQVEKVTVIYYSMVAVMVLVLTCTIVSNWRRK